MTAKTWFEGHVDQVKDDFDFRLEGYILDLTRQICNLMESKQITRSELAKRLSVSKAYITEVLTGAPNLTLESMLKLSDAIGGKLQLGINDSTAASAKKSEWIFDCSGLTYSTLKSASPIRIAMESFRQGVNVATSEDWINVLKHLERPTQIPVTTEKHKEGDDLAEFSSIAA